MTLLRKIDWNNTDYSSAMRQITALALSKRADAITDRINSVVPEGVRPHLGAGLIGAGLGGLAGIVRSSRRKDPRYLRDMLVGAGLGGTLAGAGSYGLNLLADSNKKEQVETDALKGFSGAVEVDHKTGKLRYKPVSYALSDAEANAAKRLEDRGVSPGKIKAEIQPYIERHNDALQQVKAWKTYLEHMDGLKPDERYQEGIAQATQQLAEAEANLTSIETQGRRLADSVAADIQKRRSGLSYWDQLKEGLVDFATDPFPKTDRETALDVGGGLASLGAAQTKWRRPTFFGGTSAKAKYLNPISLRGKSAPGFKGNVAAFLAPAAVRNALKAVLPAEHYSYISGETIPSGVKGRDYANARDAINYERSTK